MSTYLNRNTYATFGDPGDDKRALHSYTSDQAIADGVVVPIHVQPRLVNFNLHKDALREAFDELVEDEDLSEDESRVLARSASGRSAPTSSTTSTPPSTRSG